MFFLLSNTLDFFQGSGVLSKPKTPKSMGGWSTDDWKNYYLGDFSYSTSLAIKENSATKL